MMKTGVRREKVAYIITEYFIVVVGILSAFALNAWWQSEQVADRQAAYISRLSLELGQADEDLTQFIGDLGRTLRAVRHVNASLAAGKIIDDNLPLFEQGLLLVDVLPAIRYPVPTYQELRNTGAFRELDNESLKSLLSDIHMEFEYAEKQLEYFRSGLQDAKASLNQTVNYSAVTLKEDDSSAFSVTYDFKAMSQNLRLKNEFVEVVDTHEDWWVVAYKIHSLIRSLRKEIQEQGS